MKASVSKVSTYLRCPHKAYYKYVMKIRRILKAPKPLFGVIGHEAIERWLKNDDWTFPVDAAMADLAKLPPETQAEYAEIPTNLLKVLQGYFRLYKKPEKIVAVEQAFTVPTPGKHELEGIMDLIYMEGSDVWVQDHKFVKQIPGDSIRFLDLQTNMYYYALQQMLKHPEQLAGVEFDYIRSTPPRPPAILKSGDISRAACDTDVATYMQTVLQAGKDPAAYADMIDKLKGNHFYRRFRVPRPQGIVDALVADFDNACDLMQVSTESGAWPRRICRDCTWDCEFHDLCMAHMSNDGSAQALLDNEFEPDTRGEETTNGNEE